MARKPSGVTPQLPAPVKSNREKIIEGFMALLAERPFERIGFGDIAARSGLSLTQCRGEFSAPIWVLAAHFKEIDQKVLDGIEADMAEEPHRERLFDLLMRRIELLGPHRAAVRSLLRSAGSDPALACALNGFTVRSQQWMLTAADINSAGPRGLIRAQGLAVLYARVLRVWLDDQDPGLARTLAALDRELARGQRWSGFLDGLCRFVPTSCLPGRRSESRRRYGGDAIGEEPISV
jgi:AcrR family transcriptional regulator